MLLFRHEWNDVVKCRPSYVCIIFPYKFLSFLPLRFSIWKQPHPFVPLEEFPLNRKCHSTSYHTLFLTNVYVPKWNHCSSASIIQCESNRRWLPLNHSSTIGWRLHALHYHCVFSLAGRAHCFHYFHLIFLPLFSPAKLLKLSLPPSISTAIQFHYSNTNNKLGVNG